MANPYGSRRLVHVIPYTGSTVKYGFLTNVDASVSTALGHTAVTGAYPSGLVIGANAPKPGRAVRVRATGSESSFISADKRATAQAAGWKVSPGRVRNGSSTAKSKSVFVTFQTNKIAWRMPVYLYSLITNADLTALGITDAESTMTDLVFGARYPKLPRVSKILVPEGSESSQRLTTYCEPSKLDNLPAGWTTLRASNDAI